MILIMIIIPRSANSSSQKANNSQVLCYHYFEPFIDTLQNEECNLFSTQLTPTCWIVHICPSNQFRKKYHCSRKTCFFVYKSIISPSHRKYNEYSVDTHVLYYSCITADRIVLLPLSTATKTSFRIHKLWKKHAFTITWWPPSDHLVNTWWPQGDHLVTTFFSLFSFRTYGIHPNIQIETSNLKTPKVEVGSPRL